MLFHKRKPATSVAKGGRRLYVLCWDFKLKVKCNEMEGKGRENENSFLSFSTFVLHAKKTRKFKVIC